MGCAGRLLVLWGWGGVVTYMLKGCEIVPLKHTHSWKPALPQYKISQEEGSLSEPGGAGHRFVGLSAFIFLFIFSPNVMHRHMWKKILKIHSYFKYAKSRL